MNGIGMMMISPSMKSFPKSSPTHQSSDHKGFQDLLGSFGDIADSINLAGKESQNDKLADLLSELQSLFGSMDAEGMDLTALLQEIPLLEKQFQSLSEQTKKMIEGMWDKASGTLTSSNGVANSEILSHLKSILDEFSSLEHRSQKVEMATMWKIPEMTSRQTELSPEVKEESSKVLMSILNQLNLQLSQASQLASGQAVGTDWNKLSKQILESLNKMNASLKSMQGSIQLDQQLTNSDSKLESVFRDLMKAYQNRQQMVGTANGYRQQSQVTSKDISNWLKQAMSKYNNEELTTKSMANFQSTGMAMSKVEQYVVHLNQNQSHEAMQKQLIQEFERVLKSRNFLMNRNGAMEMQMKLKPSHLGDVLVKMTQLNGEMAVKIMVTSQAAKEMLEGNMQQLRHMFSPQQVVIEKSEQTTNQQAFDSENQEGQSAQEDRRGSSEQQSEQQHSETSSEESTFQEILMNEKV